MKLMSAARIAELQAQIDAANSAKETLKLAHRYIDWIANDAHNKRMDALPDASYWRETIGKFFEAVETAGKKFTDNRAKAVADTQSNDADDNTVNNDADDTINMSAAPDPVVADINTTYSTDQQYQYQ